MKQGSELSPIDAMTEREVVVLRIDHRKGAYRP